MMITLSTLASLLLESIPWDFITHLTGGASSGFSGGAIVALVVYFKFGDIGKDVKSLQQSFTTLNTKLEKIQQEMGLFGERIAEIEGHLDIGRRGRPR